MVAILFQIFQIRSLQDTLKLFFHTNKVLFSRLFWGGTIRLLFHEVNSLLQGFKIGFCFLFLAVIRLNDNNERKV